MLVISRKVDEVVEIGDAKVVVVGIKPGGGVRLGIKAPRNVPIHRGEIAELIREQEGEQVRTVWGRMTCGN